MTIQQYMSDPTNVPRARLARGPRAAPAPHAAGKLLIVAVMAVAALAAVGMSETAMAQTTTTEIKIGVLSTFPPIYEKGPLDAMRLAQAAWNDDAREAGINMELSLKVINVTGNPFDLSYPAFAAPQIAAAAAEGYKHFIAPSDDQFLLAVHGIVSNTPGLENTILVSPASQATFHPSLWADDNLFRLAPNAFTQSLHLLEQFHSQGVDRVIIVADAQLVQFVGPESFPDDVHDHYELPAIPIYGPDDPESTDKNAQSLTNLNNRLVDLIAEHGKEQVAVFAATTQPAFLTMAYALAGNPQLGAIHDVKWFGYNHLAHSEIIRTDGVAAAFADGVDMNVIVYEIMENDINAPLASLDAFSPGFRNYNFASYDAVHLLADAIAIGGADSPDLKDIVLEVANDNRHAVPHSDGLLGVGAIGDYMLNPATGDLLETRSYVTYHVVQSGDGYVWEPVPTPRVCR